MSCELTHLGCTSQVPSSISSKSLQLVVATEPLVPMFQLGRSVLARCSSWGSLFSRRRIFSVALPPPDAPRHRRRPTTASRQSRWQVLTPHEPVVFFKRRLLAAADRGWLADAVYGCTDGLHPQRRRLGPGGARCACASTRLQSVPREEVSSSEASTASTFDSGRASAVST